MTTALKKPISTAMILTIFLLGIFMGALDSGIVSPAREIIQNSFGVDAGYGTWMITIYTLFYAVSMPIVSKFSDRFGFKPVYIISISLFGIGSFLVGMSNFFGTFEFFLVARVIQAIGAGGIIPIANSAISQSYPEEKRGFALAMIGGMYGIGTILGPTVGSGILQFVGVEFWGWLFLINVPISILIVYLSKNLVSVKQTQLPNGKPASMDALGALILTGVIASLMYALTKLDLFDIANSIQKTSVWPFLLIFLALLPILILVERKAKDPILNLKYFINPQILKTMIIGFFVGVGMMGMVFVPQFGENVLKLKAGTGGYLITLLAIFSGVAAPISGKIIDRYGAKVTLLIGFAFTIFGTIWMALVVTQQLSFITLMVGLALMGLGVGFSMGAPLNYLILNAVPKEESTTALATLSVVRSVGVTLSPSLMIGFIVAAAKSLQDNLMTVVTTIFEPIMPKGMSLNSMMSSSAGADPSAINPFEALKSADVTTITDALNGAIATNLPSQVKPIIEDALIKSSDLIQTTFQSTLNDGYKLMFIASAVIAMIGFGVTLLLKETKIQTKGAQNEPNNLPESTTAV